MDLNEGSWSHTIVFGLPNCLICSAIALFTMVLVCTEIMFANFENKSTIVSHFCPFMKNTSMWILSKTVSPKVLFCFNFGGLRSYLLRLQMSQELIKILSFLSSSGKRSFGESVFYFLSIHYVHIHGSFRSIRPAWCPFWRLSTVALKWKPCVIY